MIENQSHIEIGPKERATSIDISPAMQDFLEAISADASSPIFLVAPDATRRVHSDMSAEAITSPLTELEERTIPVGPLGSIRIVVVRPLGVRARLPIVIYFHGADWAMGALETHQRFIRDIAYGARSVVVFVDYHRSQEGHYSVAFEEAYDATKYVTEHVDEFNVDPMRLMLAGDGVGGNMVGAVGLFAKERGGPPIRFQLLLYAVADGNIVECPHDEFAKGPWLTRYVMKWYWPLQASLEQLVDQRLALIVTDDHLLLGKCDADPGKLMLSGATVTGVRSLGDVHDSVMLNGLRDTPTTREAIALASAMLRQELAK